MLTTPSASSATEPSATASARTPLEDLIARAQVASGHMSTNRRNRDLMREMAVALVSQATLIVDLRKQLDPPRILCP
jgi:hypothetical protein